MARKKNSYSIPDYAIAAFFAILLAVGAVFASPRTGSFPVERALNATVKLDSAVGLCSGVIVLGDGLILSNAHCLGADEKVIDVTLRDGRTFKALVLVRDEAADILVLAIRGSALPYIPLDCHVAVAPGDEVTAIGHPAGMLWYMTRGIVVALNEGQDNRWTVSDAMIWFGNSGGPLFDRYGRLIGLNNAVKIGRTPFGGGQVLGYAYSLNLRHICAALHSSGIVV
jgi:serine protease Do